MSDNNKENLKQDEMTNLQKKLNHISRNLRVDIDPISWNVRRIYWVENPEEKENK